MLWNTISPSSPTFPQSDVTQGCPHHTLSLLLEGAYGRGNDTLGTESGRSIVPHPVNSGETEKMRKNQNKKKRLASKLKNMKVKKLKKFFLALKQTVM